MRGVSTSHKLRRGRAPAIVLAAAAFVAIALSGACSQAPRQGAAHTPPGTSGGGGSTPPATVTADGTVPPDGRSGTTTVWVYYSEEATGVRDGAAVTGERLVRVTRTMAAGKDTLKARLDEWLEGPTASEKARGLSLAAPGGLKTRSTSVADGVATINLPKAIEPAGGSAATMNLLGQLVHTATELEGVSGVLIKIDGSPATEFGGEGVDVSSPLTRDSVKGYFIQP